MLNFDAFKTAEHHPFQLQGDNQAALLIHGFPGSPAEMRPLAEFLNGTGWTTKGLLLPGFGPDIETLPFRSCQEWITSVLNAITNLKSDHDNVILIGNSMGAALSIQAAAKTSVDGLILFAPFWKLDNILWRTLPVLKYIFPNPKIFKRLNLDFNDPETRKGIHNFMPDADLDDPETQQAIRDTRVPVKMFGEIHTAGKIAYRVANRITIPTLIIQGQHDELVQPALTQQLVQRFNGNSHYHEVAGDHNLVSPESPDWEHTAQLISNFIGEMI